MRDSDYTVAATYPGPVACDVETDSKHPFRGRIGVVSFAWGMGEGESFATRHIEASHAALQYRLDAGLPTIFHNCAFDLHFWQRRGMRIMWDGVHDTLLMARLFNNLGQNDLKKLGLVELGILPEDKDAVKGWLASNRRKFEAEHGRKPNYLDVPDEILLPYAAQDVRLTLALYEAYTKRGIPLLYPREMVLRRKMFDAETHGVGLDVELTEKRRVQTLVEQGALARQLELKHGSPINLNSDAQMRQWLYKDLGLTSVSDTPGGKPQINEFNLMSNPHPVARLFSAYNKRVKAAEFFTSYLGFVGEDGKIHPTINTMQARTHRFSCSDPNLQQVPARNDRFHTREVFVSGAGWFVGADFDKQEIFIAACEAREDTLIADLLAGRDIYVQFARAMLKKDLISGSERTAAKVAVLSMLYGAGAPKVAESFTVNTGKVYTVEQAKVIRTNFKAAYPGLAELMERMQNIGRAFGKLTNRWGRELFVEPERAYVATDYLVQSSGRDVLADALLSVDELLPSVGGHLLWPIHDEVLMWLPEEPSPAFMEKVADAMVCNVFQLPLTAHPKSGRTLAQLK